MAVFNGLIVLSFCEKEQIYLPVNRYRNEKLRGKYTVAKARLCVVQYSVIHGLKHRGKRRKLILTIRGCLFPLATP
jgi:hypothetical protein